MTDVLTTLTSLAVGIFRQRRTPSVADEWASLGASWTTDPVLSEAQSLGLTRIHGHPALNQAVQLIFSDPELANLAPESGLGPMVLHPGGGFRTSREGLIAGLLAVAFVQLYYLRLPADEGSYVRRVLENFEELRRGARGEPVRASVLLGFSALKLPEGSQLVTPWGTVRPAPPTSDSHTDFFDVWRQKTTCILAEPKLLRVKFDPAPSPVYEYDPSEVAAQRAQILFPLACALASDESSTPPVPIVTWSTVLIPFQQGFSYSQSPPLMRSRVPADLTNRIREVEEWARLIEDAHVNAIEVSARRLISASGLRADRSDSLIDAVTVWENLVGTRSETSYRVTAALAKMLEPDRTKRQAMRKGLGDIYSVRSRVVHGEAVDAVTVDNSAAEAVRVAVRALRAGYRRGREWLALPSTKRADTILLEDP